MPISKEVMVFAATHSLADTLVEGVSKSWFPTYCDIPVVSPHYLRMLLNIPTNPGHLLNKLSEDFPYALLRQPGLTISQVRRPSGLLWQDFIIGCGHGSGYALLAKDIWNVLKDDEFVWKYQHNISWWRNKLDPWFGAYTAARIPLDEETRSMNEILKQSKRAR